MTVIKNWQTVDAKKQPYELRVDDKYPVPIKVYRPSLFTVVQYVKARVKGKKKE